MNKVLIFFFIFVGAMIIASWEFVQSQYVGEYVSEHITSYTKSKLKTEISFRNINFNLFPPGIALEQVKFKNESKNAILGEVEEFGVYFDLIKSMQKELTIKEISFKEGKVVSRSPIKALAKIKETKDRRSSTKKISIKKIIQNFRNKSPVKIGALRLKNVQLNDPSNELNINSLNVQVLRESIGAQVVLDDFNLKDFDLGHKNLEKVSVDGIVSDDKLIIKKLHVKNNKNIVKVSGLVENFKKIEQLDLDLKVYAEGNVAVIHDYFNFEQIGKINYGDLFLNASIEGKIKNISSKINLKLKNTKSDFVQIKDSSLNLEIKDNKLFFNKAKILNEGSLELLSKFEFLDFKTLKFVEEDINVKVEDFRLKNALRYLREDLSVLDAKLNGKIRFSLGKDNFHFYVTEKALLEEIVLKSNSAKILDIPYAYIENANFSVEKNKFSTSADFKIDKTNLHVDGYIHGKNVLFNARNFDLALLEMGRISGLSFAGDGKANLKVFSNSNVSKIVIDSQLKNVEIEGIRQSNLKAITLIDLRKSTLSISKIKTKHNNAQVMGDFKLDLNDLGVDANFRINNLTYANTLDIIDTHIDRQKLSNLDINGEVGAKVQLSGKLKKNQLKVNSTLTSSNINLFGENFDKFLTKVSYDRSSLYINTEQLKKSKGNIKINGVMDFDKGNLDLSANIDQTSLYEINALSYLPLNLNGMLDGKISLLVKNNLLDNLQGVLNITDSKIPGKLLDPSKVIFNYNKKDELLKAKAMIVGDNIVVDMKNYFNKKKSHIKLSSSIEDINEIIGASSFSDISDINAKGDVSLESEFYYDYQSKKISKGFLNLSKLYLVKDQIELSYNNYDSNEIEIENYKIKKWNVDLYGENIYLRSKGIGSFKNKISISNDFKIDSSTLEIFSDIVAKSRGNIFGQLKVDKEDKTFKYKLKVKGDNLEVLTKKVPMSFKETNFLLTSEDYVIYLDKVHTSLGSGKLKLKGKVDLRNIIPDISINYDLDKTSIILLEKSNLVLSGDGSFTGKRPPYQLNGRILINDLTFTNELAELTSESDSVDLDIKYLPESTYVTKNTLLSFDVYINSLNSLFVKNSMANLSFGGNLNIKGNENDIRAKGLISLSGVENKIFFKSNVYNLSKGNINFVDTESVINPVLDVEANSTISDYKLTAKINGPLDEVQLALTSRPYLSENDILSLVAFGYTEDISTNLSEEQKSAMTQTGIGALIFDQFKINETLKKELGIEINLGTEISSQNESYLSQKNATGTSSSRVNSATKVELKKEIVDNIDLAVSSTIGTATDQIQRMNVDYNLSENYVLEGIYESRTNSSDVNPQDTSIGIDFKMKWNFK
ncbi:MAG: translocation/assembly module TamB [Bacteriovoracaceae bacterium]|jgi:translocation and assembly module TamB|nr:translocation/assembly module TamB [Bacteriovoracaceae bacterium]